MQFYNHNCHAPLLKDNNVFKISKNNKAQGIDNIPAEMLKSLEEGTMTALTRICQDIDTTGVWPEDFLQSIVIPIKKKPNATACEDHRTRALRHRCRKSWVPPSIISP